MSILLARIDNRLIHGQVLEAWVPYIHADCIVVANDKVAELTLQRVLMEAAVPKGIRVVIGTVEEVVRVLTAETLKRSRVLLLFATSEDALKAYRLGLSFMELNLGNMHGGEGKTRLSCTIALDPKDVANLDCLERAGVRIVVQCIPADRQPGGGVECPCRMF
jgi:mannose/fructose/N-acetylgalactosamine-specific phosphotransferase system component IIB